jgi:hypothetical protein
MGTVFPLRLPALLGGCRRCNEREVVEGRELGAGVFTGLVSAPPVWHLEYTAPAAK